ncbi:hypothetical protein OIU84_008788 [Salix udensis]|uniref:K-box domain-containing protein n=1 Tax=Salix udensis TaxID=889485 RepID=A0AAD6JQ47_9ROSI|nr:hypothetical protein OIU84_008788 [Salix udensis]
MKRTLSRYSKLLNSPEQPKIEYNAEKPDLREVDVLKEEISKLQVKQLRLSGKDLAGLSLKELQQLENQLNEGLLCVKEKKERLLMEQLEQSRVQEQRAMLENEALRRQIEELRGLFPSTDHSVPNLSGILRDRKEKFSDRQWLRKSSCSPLYLLHRESRFRHNFAFRAANRHLSQEESPGRRKPFQ